MTDYAFREKVGIITGASRGIGKAIAVALARKGVSLALVARSEADLARVQASIEKEGGAAFPVVADVADETQVVEAIQASTEHYGRIDILVNCAGIGVFQPLVQTTTADWDHVMAVNVRGAFIACRAAVPLMAQGGGGCIINIASVVGVKGYTNQGAYTASKHALMGMTKVLAQEVQPLRIRVHAVCPGGVNTDLVGRARPDLDHSVLMRPEEIADIVLFLIGQAGNAIVDQINIRRASSTPWFSE